MLSDLLKELGVSATVVSDAESAWRALTREGRVFDADHARPAHARDVGPIAL